MNNIIEYYRNRIGFRNTKKRHKYNSIFNYIIIIILIISILINIIWKK